MPIYSDGHRRWLVRGTVVHTAVCVGFCTYLILSAPAIAAPAAPKEKPAQRSGWKQARMGVTAVVLPGCSVRLEDRAAARRQPVVIRCTRDTYYSFTARTASGAAVAVRPSPDESDGTGRYILTRTATDTEAGTDDAAALLSIDF